MEFVNEESFHTNKIEGHWRQMKARLPTHGRKKEHHSSYLAEFKWKYIHSREDLWKEFLKDIKKNYKFEQLDNASNENNKVTVSNEQCENEFQEAEI